MEKMTLSEINKYSKYIIGIFALCYFLPMLLMGEDAYFYIHDNLDGEIPTMEMLINSGNLFSMNGSAIVDNLMNGVPRGTFKSGLNSTSVFYYLFSTHYGYIVSFIFTHCAAFIGMFLLLKKHIITDENKRLYVILAALLFSVIPFYSSYGLTVAGQPLLLFAFLNLKSNYYKKWVNYLLIFVFPFFILNVLITPFFVIFIMIYLIYDLLKSGKFRTELFIGMCLLLAGTMIVDYPMISLLLLKTDFVSHRIEMKTFGSLTFPLILYDLKNVFLKTQYHSGSLPTLFIFMLSLIGLGLTYKNKIEFRKITFLLLLITFICIFYACYAFLLTMGLENIRLIKEFQWDRFYFFLPLLWCLVFGISISIISNYKIGRLFVAVMLVLQFSSTLSENKEWINNCKLIVGKDMNEATFSTYYSKQLFAEIKQYINEPVESYRVASLGLDPMIALYNGFYTLDGYSGAYDIKYKHAFRKVIANELVKSESAGKYFDNWGSRCYLYSYDLSTNGKIDSLNYDIDAFKNIGGKFIFSSVTINNPGLFGFVYLKEFKSPNKIIHLYKLK